MCAEFQEIVKPKAHHITHQFCMRIHWKKICWHCTNSVAHSSARIVRVSFTALVCYNCAWHVKSYQNPKMFRFIAAICMFTVYTHKTLFHSWMTSWRHITCTFCHYQCGSVHGLSTLCSKKLQKLHCIVQNCIDQTTFPRIWVFFLQMHIVLLT